MTFKLKYTLSNAMVTSLGSLPRRRRGPQRSSKAWWPGEPLYLLTVVAGLLLLGVSTRAFHRKAAEHNDALQQLRAGQRGRGSSGSSVTVGLGSAGQRGRRQGAMDSSGSIEPRKLTEQQLLQQEQLAEQLQAEFRSSQGTPFAIGGDNSPATSSRGRGRGRGSTAKGAAAADPDAAAAAVAAAAASTGRAERHGVHAHAQAEAQGQAGAHAQAESQGQQAQEDLQRYCEQHFGLDWLQRWGAVAQQVCSATRQLARSSGGGAGRGGTEAGKLGSGSTSYPSTLTCRSMDDTHMPAASAPHVLCDATNLRLDPTKLRRAPCPRYRPGYLCLRPTYHHYLPGAWALDCSWPGFSLDAFSKDHQQDIFGGMLFQPGLGEMAGDAEGAAAVEELPTLLVTREIQEHANVYHTFTDLLNVYITIRMLGWEGGQRQVVMLDAHPPGPLDILWPVAAAGGGAAALAAARKAQAAGGHPWDARVLASSSGGSESSAASSSNSSKGGRLLVRRVEDFEGPVLFRHAAFVPPGYTSLLFAHLYEDASCPLPTRLFSGFRRFLLGAFGLEGGGPGEAAPGSGGADGGTGTASSDDGSSGGGGGTRGGSGSDGRGKGIAIRLISRRPTRGKRKMPRQIGNEGEVVEMLQSLSASSAAGPVSVSLLDFANLTVEQQFAVVQDTDVLIGMHGAALAHALLLPPHSALVELWPQADGIWRCYQNFAQWAGALYRRVANTDPARHRETARGDVTEVDVGALRQAVEELLPLVAARRRQEAAAQAAAAAARREQ